MFLNFIICAGLIWVVVELLLLWKRKSNIWLPNVNFNRFINKFPIQNMLHDQKTLICKDHSRVQVIKIRGFDKFKECSDNIEKAKKSIDKWLKEVNKAELRLRVITIKSNEKNIEKINKVSKYADKINERWSHVTGDAFKLDYYVVIQAYSKKRKLFKSSESNQKLLEDATKTTIELLSIFKPLIVENISPKNEMTAFWNKYILGNYQTGSSDNLHEMIANTHLKFNLDEGMVNHIENKKSYVSAAAFIGWDYLVSDQIMNTIMQTNTDVMVVFNLTGISTIQAISSLSYQKKQISNILVGQKSIDQINNAISQIENGESDLYQVETTIWVRSNDQEKCKKTTSKIINDVKNMGIISTQLFQEIEVMWWNLFPGIDNNIYVNRLLSNQISSIMFWEQVHSGFSGSDWGDGSIQPIRTTLGNTYQFQWHIDHLPASLAHSVAIAPSGSGKTTLYQHLIAGSLKHNIHAYIFDRHQGTKIFTESIGGIYNDMNKMCINPLVKIDSIKDKEFLINFFIYLSGMQTHQSNIIFSQAVDLLCCLPKKKRILNEVIDAIFPALSDEKKSLLVYTDPNPWAKYVNGHKFKNNSKIAFDSLAFNNMLVGFDFTAIWNNKKLLFSLTNYLMYRIKCLAMEDKRPHLIFIDEASAFLDDSHFSKITKELLLEHRKLRGSIHLSFQNPSHLKSNKLGNIILEQCPTKFLFPNPSANENDYKIFDLNQQEWKFVKGELTVNSKFRHLVLMKRPSESIILDIDFSELGDLKKMYNSDSNSIQKFELAKNECQSKTWIDSYIYD